jgi:hypothetical protein
MHFKRSELKYYLNNVQTESLQYQLSKIMDLDRYCDGQVGYRVRSLYFDSINDECLYQKQSGQLQRKKIRLRTYGDDGTDTVRFEIKHKNGQLVKKDSARISREDAEEICQGNYALLLDYGNPVLDSIYTTFLSRAYTPKVIVEYYRVALVLPVSNIRITFDKKLCSNINHLDLFSNVKDTMPIILEGKQVLEIKFDQFLPGYLKKVISGVNAERMAISKYTLARRFHKIQKWEDN